MARPRKTQKRETAQPTGTVQARRKLERERQKQARAARAEVAEETRAAQAATAKFLANKPADSRGLERK